MNLFLNLSREFRFMLRDRAAIAILVLAAALSAGSVFGGLNEVSTQRERIEKLIEADRIDRADAQAKQEDWGGAAYYSFHLTHDPPSDLAFAALGQRDIAPWKHRIRMLALEGQIYDRDSSNPVFALSGRIDYAFVTAFLSPLLLIFLLYDLRNSERRAGRLNLLDATAASGQGPWRSRTFVRYAILSVCLLLPLALGAAVERTSPLLLAQVMILVVLSLGFWAFLIYVLARKAADGTTLLILLLAVWLSVAVILPAASRLLIDRSIPLPDGGRISLLQREAVNDAWDVPKDDTMLPFVARHPEYADHTRIDASFDWRWYYAFQSNGDASVQGLSKAYRTGIEKRDDWAGRIAWLMPPVLIERAMQSLAETDVDASLRYDASVRAYHHALQAFYYPKLFNEEAYDADALSALPEFCPPRQACEVKSSAQNQTAR